LRSIQWKAKGSKGEIYDCWVKVDDGEKTIPWMKCMCYNFVNRRIYKSGNFSDIVYRAEPCKHLKPVIEALEKQGYSVKRPKPMTGTDKCTTELRRLIFGRANGLCEANCGRPGKEIHRILQGKNGGKYNEKNCTLLCKECHKNRHFHGQ